MKMRPVLLLSFSILGVALMNCLGCAGAGDGSTTPPPSPGPTITKQPAAASIPMGLTATYTVTASGTGLSYQWYRNGAAIAGATAATYTTPATVFADSGDVFTVKVSNVGGAMTSSPAGLTVTARAPLAGDLRFRLVDTASVLSGTASFQQAYPIACPFGGGQGIAYRYGSGNGMGFFLSNNGCPWYYNVTGPSEGVSTTYQVSAAAQLAEVLGASIFTSTPPPNDPHSVIMSAGIPSVDTDAIALAYFSNSAVGAYDMHQVSVDVSALSAAVAQEGLAGRVVTALYLVGSTATYFSYGWAGDPSSVYETRVVTGSLGDVSNMATTLAGQGYIVTATGSAQAADGSGVWMVGTRLRGDTMARPVMSVAEPYAGSLVSGGYAVVAVAIQYQNNNQVMNQWVGER
ncbi:MAG: hypothetical protein V4555_21505 [Acidobacteriota bacterium]